MDRFTKEVLEYIRTNRLIPEGSRVTAGFSGGADSVCLLSVLASLRRLLKFDLSAVHVNHMIRAAEAERDEAFCREFCEEKGIPFASVRVDVPAAVEKTGMSVEEAARELRYRALREKAGDGIIAVAHHADDQAETVLFHLIRGTGLKGLSGMAPERDGIIRPLLSHDKEEILRYLSENGLPFVTDSTNADNDYARNRLRNVVIPELKKINSGASVHIVAAGSLCREAEESLEKEAEEMLERVLIAEIPGKTAELSRKELKSSPQILRRYVIIETLRRLGVPMKDWGEAHIGALSDAVLSVSGCHADLPGGVTADNTHDTIRIGKG